MLLTQSFLWALFPASNLETYGINVNGILGLNMVKTDVGAGLFAVAAFSFLYLYRGRQWFLPLVIIASGYLVIRATSLIMDGYDQTVVTGVILEALFVGVLVILNKLQKHPSEGSNTSLST